MELPLFPPETYTVKEYPSNAQTEKLYRVMLKSAGESDEVKQGVVQRDGFSEADISEEITAKEADMQMAQLVVKEDIPRDKTWNDLSSNALTEAISVFLGIDRLTRSERRPF